MTTTTIRVSEPRELLAYLPYRLGFRPRESVVVVSVREPRGELGLVARADLADVLDPREGETRARGLATHLWRDGADQAVVVIYADAARATGWWRKDVSEAAGLVATALEDAVGPAAVWVVDEQRYYSFDCEDATCCPRRGWPLAELESTQVSARMVFEGASVAEHRGELTAVAPVGAAARYNVRRVSERWVRRRADAVHEDGDHEVGSRLAAWRAQSLDAWAEAVEYVAAGGALDAPAIGRVDAGLRDALVRDGVVMACVSGVSAVRAAMAQPPEVANKLIGDTFELLFDVYAGLEPDLDALEPCLKVLREVVAHSPDRAHAPALTLLALLSWWSGDGARANGWLEGALEADPGYRLALLVATTLTGGVPPGWVRRSAANVAPLR